MLISQPIPSLVGGISQQPSTLRNGSHCELCENALPSLIDGLVKRPPTSHVAYLNSGLTTNDPLVHFINRDGVEKYVMIFEGAGTLKVYNLTTGVSYPVVIVGGPTPAYTHAQYLTATTTARKDFRVVTIADTTYFVNRNAFCSTTGLFTTPAPLKIATIWIKQGNFSQTYTININNVLAATYTTGATGNVGTDNIAAQLKTALIANGYNATQWNFSQNGSFITLWNNVGTDFGIEVVDSAGGNAMSVMKDSVVRFSDLPPAGYPGQVVTVTGDLSANNANAKYYVEFFTRGALFIPTQGTWQECPSLAIPITIEPSSMPRAINRMVDISGSVTGTPGQIYFQVGNAQWSPRMAGDQTTCPDPTFIGKTINDVFLYRNRLGFLTDTTVCLSQSGNFANFYRQTALQLLDSDPIDISAAHPRVVKLRHAVPWSRELVLFGDLTQFVLGSDNDTVTPTTVKMSAATEYESDPYIRPIPIQNFLYFPFDMNGYVGLREYYVEYYTQKRVGKAITEHIPKYIVGNPVSIASSGSAEMMTVVADGDPSSLYTYKWQWNGNTLYSSDKSQSAWVRWNFDQPNTATQILGQQYYGQMLYLVISRVTGGVTSVCLETIAIDSNQTDSIFQRSTPYFAYFTHLDRRYADNAAGVSSSYNSTTKRTTYTFPANLKFNPTAARCVTRYAPGLTWDVGVNIPILSVTSNQIVVSGDTTAMRLWFGENYTMRYRFTQFFVREAGANSSQPGPPNLQGRLQIRTLTVRSVNTGYFRIEINPTYRDQNSYIYTANIIGDSQTTLGSPPGFGGAGQVQCLVGCRNDNLYIDLVNDTPMASRFTSAEWSGLYYARAKRQ